MNQQPSAATPPRAVNYAALKNLLNKRKEDAHKGDFGHVLVIGGDLGFGGAALMAAEAALRTGAGLVSVATRAAHIGAFLSRRPELMVKGIESADELDSALSAASVIIAGPGLGRSAWSQSCLRRVLEAQRQQPVPLVVDADALNWISEGFCADLIADIDQWILTPHPGEAARLLACETSDIGLDRTKACRELQRRFGGVCILKGAGTLIAYEQAGRQKVDLCQHGNPGMASGGMGDILSGVLGGLLAQHYSLANSARLGVCIHSKSADRVAANNGERGMLATDLLPWIRKLVNPS